MPFSCKSSRCRSPFLTHKVTKRNRLNNGSHSPKVETELFSYFDTSFPVLVARAWDRCRCGVSSDSKKISGRRSAGTSGDTGNGGASAAWNQFHMMSDSPSWNHYVTPRDKEALEEAARPRERSTSARKRAIVLVSDPQKRLAFKDPPRNPGPKPG